MVLVPADDIGRGFVHVHRAILVGYGVAQTEGVQLVRGEQVLGVVEAIRPATNDVRDGAVRDGVCRQIGVLNRIVMWCCRNTTGRWRQWAPRLPPSCAPRRRYSC